MNTAKDMKPTPATDTYDEDKFGGRFDGAATIPRTIWQQPGFLTPPATTPISGAPDYKCQLPRDSTERKAHPVTTGVLDYFPDAIAEVAKVSFHGNEKHNPGEPLHWSRDKSTDHADCIGRHLIERGNRDEDGLRHSAMLAWRALANLQVEIELDRQKNALSLAPSADGEPTDGW